MVPGFPFSPFTFIFHKNIFHIAPWALLLMSVCLFNLKYKKKSLSELCWYVWTESLVTNICHIEYCIALLSLCLCCTLAQLFAIWSQSTICSVGLVYSGADHIVFALDTHCLTRSNCNSEFCVTSEPCGYTTNCVIWKNQHPRTSRSSKTSLWFYFQSLFFFWKPWCSTILWRTTIQSEKKCISFVRLIILVKNFFLFFFFFIKKSPFE